MLGPVPKMVLAAALLALAACQKADVGGECPITWGDDPQPDASCASGMEDGVACFTITADLFETGNTECENLACIMSPVSAGSRYDRKPAKGYCSKPCVSNQDCYESDTGLVCRQVVLDPVFIAQLTPELQETYLGEIKFSSYCAVPR